MTYIPVALSPVAPDCTAATAEDSAEKIGKAVSSSQHDRLDELRLRLRAHLGDSPPVSRRVDYSQSPSAESSVSGEGIGELLLQRHEKHKTGRIGSLRLPPDTGMSKRPTQTRHSSELRVQLRVNCTVCETKEEIFVDQNRPLLIYCPFCGALYH